MYFNFSLQLFFEEGGSFIQNFSCVRTHGRGVDQKRTGAYKGGGGFEILIFLRTYFMDAPIQELPVLTFFPVMKHTHTHTTHAHAHAHAHAHTHTHLSDDEFMEG